MKKKRLLTRVMFTLYWAGWAKIDVIKTVFVKGMCKHKCSQKAPMRGFISNEKKI